MEAELDLKKLGLKHIRQSEKLNTLVKRGLQRIEIVDDKFYLKMRFGYKATIGYQTYVSDKLCDAIDEAYAVHGE